MNTLQWDHTSCSSKPLSVNRYLLAARGYTVIRLIADGLRDCCLSYETHALVLYLNVFCGHTIILEVVSVSCTVIKENVPVCILKAVSVSPHRSDSRPSSFNLCLVWQLVNHIVV